MANISESIEDLVGRTPLLDLKKLSRRLGLGARMLAKLEFFNPGGSVKDRIAVSMLDAAIQAGRLQPGGVIVEPTSGNTGIGLALLCAIRGYVLHITMPESMSKERQDLMRAFGAKLHLTPAAKGMKGAIEHANELLQQIPGSIMASQFDNPANPAAHREHTGPEIYADTDGNINIFVAGVGTGGTITGVGEYLKQRNPHIHVVAVEPAASPVLSGGMPGAHKIEGIGAGFVPPVLNTGIIDEIIPVSNEDARAAAQMLAKNEGVLAGISSGAALHAAIILAQKPEHSGKTIVVLLPDTGTRYLSTGLFA